MSVNKVILIGNIGNIHNATPDTGVKYINFSVATNETIKGEKKTEWHNIVAFGKNAEHIEEWCKPGTKVYIEGKIQSSVYTDKDGIEKKSYKILCNQFDILSNFGGDKSSAPKALSKEKPQVQNDFIDDPIPF